jgi:hypothetical protein
MYSGKIAVPPGGGGENLLYMLASPSLRPDARRGGLTDLPPS